MDKKTEKSSFFSTNNFLPKATLTSLKNISTEDFKLNDWQSKDFPVLTECRIFKSLLSVLVYLERFDIIKNNNFKKIDSDNILQIALITGKLSIVKWLANNIKKDLNNFFCLKRVKDLGYIIKADNLAFIKCLYANKFLEKMITLNYEKIFETAIKCDSVKIVEFIKKERAPKFLFETILIYDKAKVFESLVANNIEILNEILLYEKLAFFDSIDIITFINKDYSHIIDKKSLLNNILVADSVESFKFLYENAPELIDMNMQLESLLTFDSIKIFKFLVGLSRSTLKHTFCLKDLPKFHSDRIFEFLLENLPQPSKGSYFSDDIYAEFEEETSSSEEVFSDDSTFNDSSFKKRKKYYSF